MMKTSKKTRIMLARARALEDSLLYRYLEACQYASNLQDCRRARAIKQRLTRVGQLIQHLYERLALENRSSAA